MQNRKESKLDTEKIIRKNKNIDKAVVSAHEPLEQELSKLGVETKPTFNIEPPLGCSSITGTNFF